MMTSVFVSYRRDDSRHQAGRLYDRLVAHFGAEQVFKDVDSIPLGLDFREVLTERVAGCDVFIAVIGDAWLSIAGKSGKRRLDDPGDFVRIEIEAALSRQIPVIPVLVGDSPVPPAEELPESLRGLSFRNGLPVRPDPDFHKDVDRLIRGINGVVSTLSERSAPRGPKTQLPEDPESADEKSSISPPAGSSTALRPTSATPMPGAPAGPRASPVPTSVRLREPAANRSRIGQWPARLGEKKPPPLPIAIPEPIVAPSLLPERRRPSWPLIVAAAVFGVFLLGVIIYVVTDKGRITIVVNDPKAVVKIDGEEVRIQDLGAPITLRAGEHALAVKWGDGEFRTRKFVVRRGDDERLRVEYKPTPKSKATVEEKKGPPPAPKPGTDPHSKEAIAAVTTSGAPPAPKPAADRHSTDAPKRIAKASGPTVPPGQITNSIGMNLVLIPAGEFMMGSPDGDGQGESDEKPQHQVRITRPFYLGTTEVTRGQFRRFVDEAGYQTEAEKDGKGGYGWNQEKKTFEQDPRYTWRSAGFEQTDEHPVVNVSWDDAVAFAAWLSRKEGQTYRLPTEAEWEYACRARTTTRYWCGDDPEGLVGVANIADGTAKAKYPDWTTIAAQDGSLYTAPVGRYKPNTWGLFDMHGNVSEWCSDGYALDYYKRSTADDPPGADGASLRVIRGGGWYREPRGARSAYRGRGAPGLRSSNLGIRLARVQSVR
jgi:formylglycine-generating enzyme